MMSPSGIGPRRVESVGGMCPCGRGLPLMGAIQTKRRIRSLPKMVAAYRHPFLLFRLSP
jgi:hypothetical protein